MQPALSTSPNSGYPAVARLKTVEDALGAGGHAAGAVFVDPEGRVLLLKRSPAEANYAGHWSLPGGKAEEGESPEEAMRREVGEEIGGYPEGEPRRIESMPTPTGMTFHTFAQRVPTRFEPKLNAEHTEHAWASLDDLPAPLHPSVARTLSEKRGEIAGDAEFKEGDHPRAPDGKFGSGGGSSGENKSKEEIRDARFENKLKEEPTKLFKDFLGHGGPGVTKEMIDEGKSRLAEIHRQLEGERKERGAAIEKERLENAEKLGGKPGEHAAALIRAGVDKEKFGPAFEALKADKSISAADLTQISQLYGHHGFKGSKGAMLDQIEKAFIREARFENKLAGDEPSLTREQAGYVFPAPGPDFCHGCSMFRPAADGQHDDKCTLVKGGIEAKGVCDHFAARGATDSAIRLALDKDSVRTIDKDGRLHVAVTNISKANVCPYKGSEIPDFEKLGLDPGKVYQLLRDPDELAKAAPTLNGVPLLRKHIPVSAEDHKPYDTIGATGTSAEFVHPYLKNGIVIWPQEDIDGVDSGAKKELSAGYHYRPDMTPGSFDGTPFDGVMRDIVFNHVALVEDGRAGPDVVVGDSAEGLDMDNREIARKMNALAVRQVSVGAVCAYVLPRLAKMALDGKKPIGLAQAFDGVTGKTFAASKPTIAARLRAIAKPHLAKDASLDDVEKVLDMLDGHEVEGGDESVSAPQHNAMEAAAHGTSNLDIPKKVGEEFARADKGKTFDAEPLKAFLKEKGMADDDITRACDMFPKPDAGATDESDEEKKKKDEADKKAAADKAAKDAEMENMVTKPAMDAALKATAEATARSIRETERDIRAKLAHVRPWVGEISPTLAFDSGSDVLRHALKTLGVPKADAMHADALEAVLSVQPKPGARPVEVERRLGMDSGSEAAKSFDAMFPGAAGITPAA